MPLNDLGLLFASTQKCCDSISSAALPVLSDAFKRAYSQRITNDQDFSRHDTIDWGYGDVAELWSRNNQTRIFVPPVAFFLAKRLVPYYQELIAYRNALAEVMNAHGLTLEDSANYNTYISTSGLSGNDQALLQRFVSDSDWWGGGRAIKRPDFFESALMKCARLTQETQTEIARISKQLSEDQKLNGLLVEVPASQNTGPKSGLVDCLSVALKRFAEERSGNTCKGNYMNVNVNVRAFFEPLDADAVSKMDATAFKDFCINHTWSLTNGAAWSIVSQYSNDERKKCCDFFARLFSDPNPSTVFNGYHPKGVGSSCISELLMKFSPDRFGFYNEASHESLVWLGLLHGEFDRKYGWFQYGLAQGALSTIVQKMRELGIRSTLNDDAPPADFLAANEFLWFVHENKKLIQEEVNKMQLKDAKSTPVANKGKQLDLDPNKENDKLMLRLMASLRAKPFVILAGHSGTGKSRLVRKLAYMTCNVEELRDPEDGALNFCMIQVKPNWHDSADLLGYRSAIKDNRYVGTKLLEFLFRAYAYPSTPFFLCLDEMNLAPVEQYFAEFLSAMESVRPVAPADKDGTGPFSSDKIVDLDVDKDRNLDELGCGWVQSFEWVKTHGITIPKNLFVVGTVNMDETTCQFSRKVLDRAMTIEMTNVNFDDYGSVSEPSFDDLLDGSLISTLLNRPVRIEKLDDEDKDPDSPLRAVQTCLENTPFAVAYRFANEYSLYKRALEAFDPGRKMGFDALDHAVLMKVLPRISGERRYVSELFCGHEDDTQKDSPQKGSLLAVFKDDSSSSRKKMRDILDRKGRYLTFWP